MTLSGTGIWSAGLTASGADEAAEAAAELEELGYASLWVPAFGADSFQSVEALLSATRRVVVATGILSVWVGSAEDTARRTATIHQQFGDRFLLGLGVSHAPLVEAIADGTRYERPLRVMETYLDALDRAPEPVAVDHRVLAALGPKMLQIARRRAAGALPYNVTPEHTAVAREALGPSKVLVAEQAVLLSDEASQARRIGREFLTHYLGLPNYANNLRRLGFTEDDLGHGGSDRLVDSLIAWGDVEDIARRVAEHRQAGADSVCIQVVSEGGIAGMVALPRPAWRRLARADCSLIPRRPSLGCSCAPCRPSDQGFSHGSTSPLYFPFSLYNLSVMFMVATSEQGAVGDGGPPQLDAIFAALAHPARRAIVARLAIGPASATELGAPLAMSQPAVSKNLKVLEQAGLITRGRDAQWRPCALRPEALALADQWVRTFEQTWEARLDRLGTYLEQTKGDSNA